ncbi:hypothetical protein ANN_07327 [Periplaneta americana]|uniref:Uncharacterized protein n=1 Tax=Periplaneta americana TaxID=6978 RepID=A0ABQ8SYZ0_PERAM|nr:hypothetical protein ANN_07327 [Periplaneta americana]
MAGLCKGGNEPPGSLKASRIVSLSTVTRRNVLKQDNLKSMLHYCSITMFLGTQSADLANNADVSGGVIELWGRLQQRRALRHSCFLHFVLTLALRQSEFAVRFQADGMKFIVDRGKFSSATPRRHMALSSQHTLARPTAGAAIDDSSSRKLQLANRDNSIHVCDLMTCYDINIHLQHYPPSSHPAKTFSWLEHSIAPSSPVLDAQLSRGIKSSSARLRSRRVLRHSLELRYQGDEQLLPTHAYPHHMPVYQVASGHGAAGCICSREMFATPAAFVGIEQTQIRFQADSVVE